MEALGWILAAIFAVVALFLAIRRRPAAAANVATERGAPVGAGSGPGRSEDETWAGGADEAEVLGELARYLENSVTVPLEEGLRKGGLEGAAEDAVDALRDLIVFGRARRPGSRSRENLVGVLQAVTREYTLDTGTPVKLSAPEAAVNVMMEAEPFKDALYLLLANAGRFGGGETIEVVVETRGTQAEVGVRDRGPGFSGEALFSAFRPFWSSESDALGLGLPHAKRLIEGQGGTLRVGNRPERGAEAIVSIPIAGS